MFLSDISIKRPIMMSMMLIVFVLFGALAYLGMNLELTPPFDLPMITVQTLYGGAGSEELELQVSQKIEDAVASIAGIDYVQSYSMENVSLVMVAFDLDKDVYRALEEVKDKIDGLVNDLPAGADPPLVQRWDPLVMPVIDLVLTGPLPVTGLYDLADRTLSPVLSQIPGVADVKISGGRKREIRIEFDGRVVLQRMISLSMVGQILAAQNLNMPGGTFQRSGQDFSVSMKGEFSDVETIRDLDIPTAHGLKKLGDIATVMDSGEDVRERIIYYDRQSDMRDAGALLLSLMKTSDGNPVNIYRKMGSHLKDIETMLPEGCALHVVNEHASFIQSSVRDTTVNILLGILLTSAVLFFFLHDYRSTIIVALSMPLSIISTFLFLQLAGFTLNIMSLMGLSTAVGILVANSVVVLENIFRHKRFGLGRQESAAIGTGEAAVAVIASTLTNLVVFLPLGTMSSIAGRLFSQFSLTVVFATLFSLLTAFTLTPMLASRILPDHDDKTHPAGRKLEQMFTSWEHAYRRILTRLLLDKKRGAGVILISLLLLALSIVVAGRLGFEFIPEMDEGFIGVKVELPAGTGLEVTEQTLLRMEEKIRHYPDVTHYWIEMGNLGEADIGVNLAYLKIKLVDTAARSRGTRELTGILREDFSNIPNIRISAAPLTSLASGRSDVEFYLRGPDSGTLHRIATDMSAAMRRVPGLINLNVSAEPGKPQVTITPRRPVLSHTGLSVYDVALAMRSSIEGLVTTSYRDRGDEYDIRVTLNDESVDSPDNIGAIPVSGRAGVYRLDQLADITFTEADNKIIHYNRLPSILFQCDAGEGHPTSDLMTEITAIVDRFNLPHGYGIQMSGMSKEMETTSRAIVRAFIIAIALTYMLLAAILESVTQPLIILATVPLALIGVFVGLAVTGLTMNIISMLAMVMLIGIVVNSAILLLDYTNQLVRKRGMNVQDALITACPTRLKPILMSTIAIILGMLPMAAGLGKSGSELRQPMGVVSIGGLIVSALLALVVIPVLYNMVSRRRPAADKE
ncbi:efflux RND transporter permease subunit [bacterium]|nr:efflux RND transporter permease subunit [bacterium]